MLCFWGLLGNVSIRGDGRYRRELTSVLLAADGSRYIPESAKKEVVFEGGCRCGGITYSCTAAPSNITLCHCRACQQISGAGFLPFVDVPTEALRLTSSLTLKTLKLSDFANRTFCTGCGAPISMVYHFHAQVTALTMGSVNLETLKGEPPKVAQHIFLKEKAPWVMLPDDGTERLETASFAHLLVPESKPE